MNRDGETGFLVAPGNEADLADKIRILLDDEKMRLRMGEQAARRVRAFFTWEKVADRLQKVYSRALGSGKR